MHKIMNIYRYCGFQGIYTKLKDKYFNTYHRYLKNEIIPTKDEMKQGIATFHYTPLISVIIPLYQPDFSELKQLFDSILVDNPYEKIELCLVNDGAIDANLDEFIKEYQKEFANKLQYQINDSNQGIAHASNDAINMSKGEYIALVDQDDLLSPHAFFEYVRALQKCQYDFLYSDEDMITPNGERFNPQFKPDWSPHTLFSRMYVNHLSMYKKALVQKSGGFRSEYDGCQDYDLLLRTSLYFKNVYHCSKILYHWRTSKTSIATDITNKSYIIERAEKAIKDHLETRQIDSEVLVIPEQLIYNINFPKQVVTDILVLFFASQNLSETLISLELLLKNFKGNSANNKIYVFDSFFDEKRKDRIKQIASCIEVFEYAEAKVKAEIISTKATYLLFVSENCLFETDMVISKLIALAKLPKVGIVSPTIIDAHGIIVKGGGIIGANQELLYSGYSTPFGESDYYGANFSLVNYAVANQECFLVKKELLLNVTLPISNTPTAFVGLCLNLLDNDCYNIIDGSIYVRKKNHSRKAIPFFNEKELMLKGKRSIEMDKFYNENFLREKNRLYKLK